MNRFHRDAMTVWLIHSIAKLANEIGLFFSSASVPFPMEMYRWIQCWIDGPWQKSSTDRPKQKTKSKAHFPIGKLIQNHHTQRFSCFRLSHFNGAFIPLKIFSTENKTKSQQLTTEFSVRNIFASLRTEIFGNHELDLSHFVVVVLFWEIAILNMRVAFFHALSNVRAFPSFSDTKIDSSKITNNNNSNNSNSIKENK